MFIYLGRISRYLTTPSLLVGDMIDDRVDDDVISVA